MQNDVRWMFGGVALSVNCSAHACTAYHAYKCTPDVTLRRSLPGLPHVPSSCMETGLLIVKENLKERGESITLSHTTHDTITPKIVEYINAAH